MGGKENVALGRPLLAVERVRVFLVLYYSYCRERVLVRGNMCFYNTYSTKTIRGKKSTKNEAAKTIRDYLF